MSTGKRILVNGLLAAVPLAVIGAMLGSLAGMYLSAPPPARLGPLDPSAPPRPAVDPAAADSLVWKLPIALAALGFGFVAAAEGLLSVWRTPAPSPAKPDPNKVAEEIIQSLLREAEKERPQMNADEHRSAVNTNS